MNQLNSVLIEGNLTRDPELKYTARGTAICTLSIAHNRFFKRNTEWEKEASFFDAVVFGRQAETCSEYLSKGRGVRVVGRLKQECWQDTQGNNRSKIRIVAEHVEFKSKEDPAKDVQVPLVGEAENEDITDEESNDGLPF